MITINHDMGYLRTAQEQEAEIERSRIYHLRLEQNDADLRALEDQIGVMTVAEFHERKTAIEETRRTLKAEWEKEK